MEINLQQGINRHYKTQSKSVHNKTSKRANPATYYALSGENARKLVTIKKIDREIVIGFLALKMVYAGADAQCTQKRNRMMVHGLIRATEFERFVDREKAEGRTTGYVYCELKQYRRKIYYRCFETIGINTFKFLDHEPLMNTSNGDELSELAEKGLDEFYRFEVFTYLLDQAIDGSICIDGIGSIQGENLYFYTHSTSFPISLI